MQPLTHTPYIKFTTLVAPSFHTSVQRILKRGPLLHLTNPDMLKVFQFDPFDYHSIIDVVKGF